MNINANNLYVDYEALDVVYRDTGNIKVESHKHVPFNQALADMQKDGSTFGFRYRNISVYPGKGEESEKIENWTLNFSDEAALNTAEEFKSAIQTTKELGKKVITK